MRGMMKHDLCLVNNPYVVFFAQQGVTKALVQGRDRFMHQLLSGGALTSRSVYFIFCAGRSDALKLSARLCD